MNHPVHDTPADVEGRETLKSLVAKNSVIVCVGSGGVGKTTTAATLGIAGAASGRRTLVITIDPARRLANALGIQSLGHDPQPVNPVLIQRAATSLGLSSAADGQAPATLHAMMLDLKAGWDDMLRRTAPDAATVDAIVANRFYRVLSTELPGAHEFIACEHLQHLAQGGDYDLVVLDTPPTQNALDFLDAPSRILGVLDNDAFRFFARKRSSRFSLGFLDGAAGRAQSVIARFTGKEMLDDLAAFMTLLKDLYQPLTERTKRFVALLGGKTSAFVIVAAPQPSALSEAAFFADELQRRDLPLAALIVNRLTPPPVAAEAALEGETLDLRLGEVLGADDGATLAAALDHAVVEERRLANLEAAALAQTQAALGGVPTVRLPRLSDAIHDAGRLVELVPHLVASDR